MKMFFNDDIKEPNEKKQILINALQQGFDDIEAGRISTQSIDEIFDEATSQ